MIVGINNRPVDLNVNPTKEKKLTNTRTVLKDEATTLKIITPINLERAIDFIKEDEMVEVTPKSIRMRKIILQENMRRSHL